MLNDVDETLKAVLRERGGLDADEIDIAFEAPDREWSARVGRPTVNIYLYDLRENLQMRETEWIIERDSDGSVASRRQPPRRFDFSYVCTAWTSDIEDEHRLLWQVLATLIRYPELPQELLRGELASCTVPIGTQVAQPGGLLREPAEVWSALDNRIRPSVNLVVTLPIEDMDALTSPLVLTKRVRVRGDRQWSRIGAPPPEELLQIAGTVRDDDGGILSGAQVRVRDHGFSTVSGRNGQWWITGIPAGEYTLVAEANGDVAERSVRVPGDDYDLTLVPVGSERASRRSRGGKND